MSQYLIGVLVGVGCAMVAEWLMIGIILLGRKIVLKIAYKKSIKQLDELRAEFESMGLGSWADDED